MDTLSNQENIKETMNIIRQWNYLTKPIFLISVSILLFLQLASGQEIVFKEVNLSEEDNNDFVTGIAQDLNGLMWFSTKVGLLSYDGNSLTSYKNIPINPNSLASNFTETVYADFNGKLWIGTLGSGLDRFDPESGLVTHFRHDPEDPSSLSSDTVTQVLRDQQGVLWVGTHGGLDRFDPETGKFDHYRSIPDDNTTISHNQVRVLYEDSRGTLWIGTGSPYLDNGGGPDGGGLNRMDSKTETFTRYMHDPEDKNSLVSNKIGAIYEDDQGVLWIGTGNNGLHRMNQQRGTLERLLYDPENPNQFSGPERTPDLPEYEHITFITQDQVGSYWYGTTQQGVFYFNPRHGKMINYGQGNTSTAGFGSLGSWVGYTSRDGMFWLGGINQGSIYRVNPSPQKIPYIQMQAAVNSIYEEPNGDLWIATDNKIIKKDKGTAGQNEIDISTDNQEEEFFQIIREDRQGNIWIAGNGGVGLWDKEKEKLIRYKNDPDKPNSLSNNNVITLYEDDDANFWVGTTDGLNLMDRKAGTFKKYYLNQEDTAFIGRNIVTSVLKDQSGKLWVGTWNGSGVYQLNPVNKKSRPYLTGANIVCLFEDSRGEVWLGSNYGLFRYDPIEDNFIRYLDPFTVIGISSVFSITEDDQNYLWLSTNKGLARINPGRNETNKLDKAYGLDSIRFTWNSSYKGRNGDLYFGVDGGYVKFDPANVIQDSQPPEIIFTGFRLADQTVNPGDNSPLKQNIAQAEEIRLEYNQNVFSFDYAIIDFVNPEENQLTYLLENYDKNWLMPNSDRRAYYFNVPPGKYTFRIRGSNSYGVWAEKRINLTILPPWWKSYWAYATYGLLLVLLVFAFDRVQRRRIQLKERQKTQKRELAQAREIEKAYKELKNTQSQLIQSEKMASLGELTAGIAHEIQNPLNFVNNFSEVNAELIGELKEEIDKKNYKEVKAIADDIAKNEEKISFHGKRADSIVKGMLQHSRSSNGQKTPTDINALADEYLRLAYHGLRAKDKSFNAEFSADQDASLPKISVIGQDIGRVLLNLINNAFFAVAEKKKNAPPEYTPEVKVITKHTGNQAEIRVQDNGNGIPAEIREKIFQPFYTTKPTGQGTGLGLSMSYDIITNSHGGTIEVVSEPGVGTEFIVRLPANS